MPLDLQAHSAESKPSLSSRLIAVGLVRSVAWVAAVSVLASLAITGLAHLLAPPSVDLLTPGGIAVNIGVPLMVAPVVGFLLMRMLIELDIARKTVHELAIKDGLTEVYNRRYFISQMDVEFAKSQRYKTPTAVIMLDADHFKRVNDTYGHGVGDVVLKKQRAAICLPAAQYKMCWPATGAKSSLCCCLKRMRSVPSCWLNACLLA